jgi:hypothetical protein
MITPSSTIPPGIGWPTDRPGIDSKRRSRRPHAPGSSRRARATAAEPTRPTVTSLSRDPAQLRAAWPSKHACFELAVTSHSTGLHVKLSTWPHMGPALEECFVIHTLAEFTRWIGKAPTKFDHPIAHEEVKRFAHECLSR